MARAFVHQYLGSAFHDNDFCLAGIYCFPLRFFLSVLKSPESQVTLGETDQQMRFSLCVCIAPHLRSKLTINSTQNLEGSRNDRFLFQLTTRSSDNITSEFTK